jgi:hypothetical protein
LTEAATATNVEHDRSNKEAGMRLTTGDQIRHRRRNQYGTFHGDTFNGVPAGDADTVWVVFDGSDTAERVSRHQLAKVVG